MTPTPPSASSSRASLNSPDNFRVVRKRNRIPLSCAPCRHRKLKCNRQSPCDNCIKRGDGASCAYAAPAARKKSSSSTANASPDDMQNRIDRLEGLVLSLMSTGSQSGGGANQEMSSHPGSIGSGSLGPNLDSNLDDSQLMDMQSDRGEDESETDGVTKGLGILKVDAADQQKTVYLGEAHWAALLNEIGEVKNYFAQHKKEFEAQLEKVTQARKAQGNADVGSGPVLLFGASQPPPRSEILAALPSKYTCDILIGRYFNTFDPATHILHGPVFQKQYQAHWADPSKTAIMWIGMLFAMLRLAMISYGREGDEPPEFRGKTFDMAAAYRTQMAHCLITADYTKPNNFVIETLIFHLHAEYTSCRDSEASIWVLAGMITRLAMRMGYHRDSRLFPTISAFQGEMRRRVWTFVRTADLLFSFQIGLPSMVRIGDSDTELPRNIPDEAFDEDSKELSPARPATEATAISFMIAKGRLTLGFGKVLEEVNGLNKHSYDDILKIDKWLQDVYQNIPDHLKLREMEEQQLAPLTLIYARFSLATVYHKSQCVLHRRFIRQARGNNKYMHSRRTCIDSAMQLLNLQAIQHQHSQDRGRMRSLRNHVNSLTTHDFLLAASVLMMDLYNHRERSESDISTPNTSVSGLSGSHQGSSVSGGSGASDGVYMQGLSYSREEVLKALETSRDVWYANRDVSIEAYKASELLSLLLYNLRLPYSPSQTNTQIPKAPNPNGNLNNSNDEQTAAMTLGMLQSGGMGSTNPQVASLAQQAQQGLAWDISSKNIENPMMNAFLNSQVNPGQALNNQPLPTPGIFGSTNASSVYPDAFFNNAAGMDMNMNMNFDWDTWDSYMQSSNLSLDPAANLWNTGASPDSNNLFSQQQTTSVDSDTNNSNSNMFGSVTAKNDKLFDLSKSNNGSAAHDQNSGNVENGQNAGTGGETFMGANTPPGSGPMGIGGWRWTVMDGAQERRQLGGGS